MSGVFRDDAGAIDGAAVQNFFLIVAPPLEVSNQYLPVLGKIAQFAKDAEVPERLLDLDTPDEFLALLEGHWAASDNELRTVRQASEESGYSADHIRRMARGGKIEVAAHAGRRPLFRRKDLPRKTAVAREGFTAYDPNADARQMAARRKGAIS